MGISIFTPVVATLLFFVIAAGRVGVTESRVTTAAHAAARIASQHRHTNTAEIAAQTTAMASLIEADVHCKDGPQIHMHELNLQPAGKVRLQVSCKVSFADLIMPGLPDTLTVSAEATAVVDNYRSEITW
ncbi:MAG: hypothetical protein F4138_07650 [Acidimicrobiia bacterium]|nr:hypothetical protein [Acidimicrobiia bacterium]MYC57546.1 hypothetical protein [Acidimicrobiia bacterium]MYG94837.1 hypothetical protein [Acidimicrobiia bacterium]MYI30090.1 hypothetical protein [Acidimicrobiia bacterium]